MSRDTPVYTVPVLIVTANDGTLFTCTACCPPNTTDASPRFWRVTDQKGREFAGPAYVPCEAPTETQRRVAEWWDAIKGSPPTPSST
jgi:hypothetical protein